MSFAPQFSFLSAQPSLLPWPTPYYLTPVCAIHPHDPAGVQGWGPDPNPAAQHTAQQVAVAAVNAVMETVRLDAVDAKADLALEHEVQEQAWNARLVAQRVEAAELRARLAYVLREVAVAKAALATEQLARLAAADALVYARVLNQLLKAREAAVKVRAVSGRSGPATSLRQAAALPLLC